MFYCEPYNESNVVKLSKLIDDMNNIEICYSDDPTEPMLLCQTRINQNPVKFKTYISRNVISSRIIENEMVQDHIILTNQQQVVQFLNTCFLPYDPGNDQLYEEKNVTNGDIFSTLLQHTEIFNDKSVTSFGNWCSSKKVDFLMCKPKRKRYANNSMISVRSLYILKKEYFTEIVKRIVLFLTEYQTEIRNLKKQGFKILGYARKSEGAEDHETRIRLLNLMFDHVFVSYNSQANDPLAERDMKQKDELLTQLSAEGNTQDMLAYITNTEKICLVALDHAGLSTNCNDLYGFLTQHPNLEKIMIDTMPTESVIHVYERNRLLNEPEMLKKFECRKKPHQRSK
ncbi:MAG: hypothetical protein EXX96DRAFT_539968 [Benjaminiella poitrasii]|nr:MAG: hypothetical protein EXX96DRAFT_539968 [Benjaminiella poitrasii]